MTFLVKKVDTLSGSEFLETRIDPRRIGMFYTPINSRPSVDPIAFDDAFDRPDIACDEGGGGVRTSSDIHRCCGEGMVSLVCI